MLNIQVGDTTIQKGIEYICILSDGSGGVVWREKSKGFQPVSDEDMQKISWAASRMWDALPNDKKALINQQQLELKQKLTKEKAL